MPSDDRPNAAILRRSSVRLSMLLVCHSCSLTMIYEDWCDENSHMIVLNSYPRLNLFPDKWRVGTGHG